LVTCPARPALSGQGGQVMIIAGTGQSQVTKTFTKQVAGYECCNLSTCDKFYTLDIVNIFSKVIQKEKE